jgi:hypothetical protein
MPPRRLRLDAKGRIAGPNGVSESSPSILTIDRSKTGRHIDEVIAVLEGPQAWRDNARKRIETAFSKGGQVDSRDVKSVEGFLATVIDGLEVKGRREKSASLAIAVSAGKTLLVGARGGAQAYLITGQEVSGVVPGDSANLPTQGFVGRVAPSRGDVLLLCDRFTAASIGHQELRKTEASLDLGDAADWLATLAWTRSGSPSSLIMARSLTGPAPAVGPVEDFEEPGITHIFPRRRVIAIAAAVAAALFIGLALGRNLLPPTSSASTLKSPTHLYSRSLGDGRVELMWKPRGQSEVAYRVYIAHMVKATAQPHLVVSHILKPGHSYTWYVRTTNGVKTSKPSRPSTVLIVPPDARLHIVSPTGKLVLNRKSPVAFCFSTSPADTQYTLTVVGVHNPITRTFSPRDMTMIGKPVGCYSRRLVPGRDYTWRVGATGSGGSGIQWTAWRHLHVMASSSSNRKTTATSTPIPVITSTPVTEPTFEPTSEPTAVATAVPTAAPTPTSGGIQTCSNPPFC